MGNGATRALDRVSAAIGQLASAPIQFEASGDVPRAGLLLAVPALLSMGLLRSSAERYALPPGYYGLNSILLLLAMMALARVKSIEQLRYVLPGEMGNLLGLDRVPEVRTWRSKLAILSQERGALRAGTASWLRCGWAWGRRPKRCSTLTDTYGCITVRPRNCRGIT
jgi:hypothetical protein